MEKTYITKGQFFTIVYSYIASNEMVRGFYYRKYGNNTWIIHLLAIPIAILLYHIYSYIYRNTNYSDFKTAIEKIMGKFFSKIIFIIYAIYFSFLLYMTIRDLGELIHIYFLHYGKIWIIAALILIVALYGVSKGIECIGRYSGFAFGIAVVFFIIFTVLLISYNEADYENILPFMPHGLKIYLKPALQMAYSVPFGEGFILIFIFQYIRPQEKKKAFKTTYLSVLSIGFSYFVITLFNIFYLKAEQIDPGFTLTMRLWRKIDITQLVQRFDLIVLNIIIFFVITKIIILLWSSGKMVLATIKVKTEKLVYIIIAIILFFILNRVGQSYSKVVDFRMKIAIPYIKAILEVFIPIIIVILSFIRKKKINQELNQAEYI